MALLQISEPGLTPEPHQRKRAIGIDLGTTNSLIASVINSSARVLPDEMEEMMTPSVVYYGSKKSEDLDRSENISDSSSRRDPQNVTGNHYPLVGELAKQMSHYDPENTIISVKRFLGRTLEDILKRNSDLPYQFKTTENGLPQFVTEQRTLNPIEVSADILRHLKSQAQKSLAGSLDGVVITVPAYFDDAQRVATKEAAKLAGLNLLRLLNEPTAAAVAYGFSTQEEGVIAVYDLGGGTFDISILRLHKGVFEVLSTGGDTFLGGDDFDQLIVQWFKDACHLGELSAIEQRKLLMLATDAKTELSEALETELKFGSYQQTLTRIQFEDLISPLVKKSIQSCRRALKDSGMKGDEVSKVIMVGGSTRVPLVRKMVGDFFETEPLISIDPDQVVALGAAIQANQLVGNKADSELLLLDVIPLSLGIETMGGLVEKIIHRNTSIPIAKAQEFTTFKDGQTRMRIHVVQGERDLVSDCKSLASFVLKDIPPMVAGAAHIVVTYQVDADGLLSVTAKEKSSGVYTEIQVQPAFGLTDDEITEMLEASFEYALQDKQERELIEQRVDAERLISDLEVALQKEGEKLLDSNAIKNIQEAIEQLKESCQSQSADQIRAQIKVVNSVTAYFASLRMDYAIKDALTGQSVESISDTFK